MQQKVDLKDPEGVASRIVSPAEIVQEHFAFDPYRSIIPSEVRHISERLRTFGETMLVQYIEDGSVYALKSVSKKGIMRALQAEHMMSERRYRFSGEAKGVDCSRRSSTLSSSPSASPSRLPTVSSWFVSFFTKNVG